MSQKTLYERLGGYDAISAVANDLLPRLQADATLGRFWSHRGDDGIAREKQLKGWRREKKLDLIQRSNPGWEDLSADWVC